MDDLNIQVLNGFGVKAKRVVKEKSYYLCSTDNGCKFVRKNFDSGDRVMFQHEIKEQLCAKGFRNTDRFTLSLAGKPYVLFEDNVYTMTDAYAFTEISFADNRMFEKAVGQAAAFHKAARNLRFGGKVFHGETNLMETCAKNIAEMAGIKKRLASGKRLSDFDVLFLKNYGFYMAKLETAAELLAKTNLEQYQNRARTCNTICHGLLKEENMPLCGGEMFIVSFSHAVVGYALFDLCSLIQRYVKRIPSRVLPIENVIRLYDRQCALAGEELRILYPLLIYPHKFIRICRQYYSKNRTWTPSAMTNRMETVVSGKDVYDAYVSGLLRM